MITNRIPAFSWAWCLSLFFLLTPGGTEMLQAADLKIQAQLIWGTNDQKPDDAKLKELDAKLQERLKGVFKWKNYFEVERKKFALGAATPKERVKMSPKCEIEVQDLGNSVVEVKLYGDGNLVVTKRQALTPGELLVVAGDGKNDTAWFVVLTPVGP